MDRTDRIRQRQVFREASPYEQAQIEAQRQRALAEALAQQAYVPTEGAAAPIPSAAPLVQALQGFMTARAGRKAAEAETKAKQMETVAGRQIAGRVFGGAPVTEVDTTPDASGLAEVAIQSPYRASPMDALRMASTPQGVAAVKGNPALAAALQRSMAQPEAEEFYAPTETESGLVQFGKRGSKRETGYKPPSKPPEGPKVGAVSPSDFTPASIAKFQATGNFADLVPVEKTGPVTNIFTPKDTFKLEGELRSEYGSKLKDYQSIRSAYERIENAIQSGAGDISVVYAFAKMNDPTSVVRESEFETVAKSGSLGQRIKNLVEQATTGRMNPELRENLRQQAREIYLSSQAQADLVKSQYQSLAENYGLDPRKVLSGVDVNPVWSSTDEARLEELKRKQAGGGQPSAPR